MPDPIHSAREANSRYRQIVESISGSEARLQLALDVGGIAVWQADLKTAEITWWPGMEAMHGLPVGAAPLAMSEYRELIHPHERPIVMEALRNALAGKEGQRAEYRVHWPDGSVHWIEARAKLLLDAKGEPWGLAGVCMEITRRKHIESDLKFLADASAELASLTDFQGTLERIARLAVPHFADWCSVDLLSETGTLDRVAVAHVDPRKESFARELYQRFSLDTSRVTGGGPWNIIRTGQAERLREITDEMLAHSIGNPDYLAAVRALGPRSYLGVPLKIRERTMGVITFVSAESLRRYSRADQALAEDLARRAAVAIENAKLLRALRDSDRAKDVFLATLAHELRNPLAPVSNGLAILKHVAADARLVDETVDMMKRQVGLLGRLVDDLLDISRITTGKIELHKEPTQLADIVLSAIETSRPHIDAARHRLTLQLPTEPTDIEADPVRLAQVFANLLNNAAKYTRPGGTIDVIVRAEPQRFVVRVRDNGIGIAPQMLSSVFAPFTQVTHPAQRSQGGLGIGLSLVDGLVRMHGGTVHARSAGLEQGSEFIVYLPRTWPAASRAASRAQLAASTPAAAVQGNSHRRILVVDDNHDAADTLAQLLEMLGHVVSVARDGLAALALISQFRPDVVLLDIGLPGINGYEVARRIRQMDAIEQPVLIALTGWGQPQDKRLAAEAGFDEHWTKPVDATRLQDLPSRPIMR